MCAPSQYPFRRLLLISPNQVTCATFARQHAELASMPRVDSICLEKPKINPHIPDMITTLARVMDVTEDDISLKATTSEKMSFVGREEGIKAYASVLIYQLD